MQYVLRLEKMIYVYFQGDSASITSGLIDQYLSGEFDVSYPLIK